MRIEANFRTHVANRGGASRASGGAVFQPSMGAGETMRAANASPAASVAGIDTILALQCVEDATQAPRRKAVRRGQGLLAGLEAVRADLLMGRISPDRLDELVNLVIEAREETLPGLDALLDDIELRVRVELAKFGLYPDF